MTSVVLSISALLAGIGMLLLGSGMLGTLLGMRMVEAGFPTSVAGLVMSAYFGGFVLGSLYGSRLIMSVGHIRAFACFATVFSAASLAHGFMVDAWLWAGLRLVQGFCTVSLYMCTESWLNERATNETRGQILSLYMITLYLAQGAGQFLLNISDPSGFGLFALTSILISLSLVPVAAARVPGPALPEPGRLRMRQLYRVSPLGLVGAFGGGMILGGFYGMGPVYAGLIGLPVSQTALFMSAAIVGGLVLQFPIGRLSDRFDRRHVIVALCGLLTVFSLVAMPAPAWTLWGFLAVIALFGGLSFAVYPMSAAHVNDLIEPGQFVPASAGLLMAYGVGATAGPLAAAALMDTIGPLGLFGFFAVVGMATGGFAVWRMAQRPPVPLEAQSPYQPVPRTTAVLTELHPQYEEDQLSFDWSAPPPPPDPAPAPADGGWGDDDYEGDDDYGGGAGNGSDARRSAPA